MTQLFIKNMVCDRCKMVVRQELEKLGVHPEYVELGEIRLAEEHLSADLLLRIDNSLNAVGFERIDSRKARLIESVKNKVITLIHHTDRLDRKFNWSKILSDEAHYEYNYLSNLFSAMEGITIEQYIIRQKVEKAKELLLYDELSLSEISYRLGYSSIAHLSAQFKKITGMTPSELKKTRDPRRKPLDNIL